LKQSKIKLLRLLLLL